MTQVADYITDYGVELLYFPMRVGVDPRNGNLLLSYLPPNIQEKYRTEKDNFQGCRNGNVIPRYLAFDFAGTVVTCEVPERLTSEEIRFSKEQSEATSLSYFGEFINYSELKWLADLTTT